LIFSIEAMKIWLSGKKISAWTLPFFYKKLSSIRIHIFFRQGCKIWTFFCIMFHFLTLVTLNYWQIIFQISILASLWL
jgi:hypothetical protein